MHSRHRPFMNFPPSRTTVWTSVPTPRPQTDTQTSWCQDSLCLSQASASWRQPPPHAAAVRSCVHVCEGVKVWACLHMCVSVFVCAQVCENECVSLWLCGCAHGCKSVCECKCVRVETECMTVGASSELGKGKRAHGLLVEMDVTGVCQPLGVCLTPQPAAAPACGWWRHIRVFLSDWNKWHDPWQSRRDSLESLGPEWGEVKTLKVQGSGCWGAEPEGSEKQASPHFRRACSAFIPFILVMGILEEGSTVPCDLTFSFWRFEGGPPAPADPCGVHPRLGHTHHILLVSKLLNPWDPPKSRSWKE